MPALLLCVLIAAAFAIQHRLDVRSIARVAEGRRWSQARIRWTPWTRGSALRSRWERSYWLRYRDEAGREQRRLCWVSPAGVSLEAARAVGGEPAAPRRPLARPWLLLLSIGAGGFLGAALGICGAFVLYPGSNIAPAYGVIWITPAGLVAGALFGALRRR